MVVSVIMGYITDWNHLVTYGNTCLSTSVCLRKILFRKVGYVYMALLKGNIV